MSNTRPSSIPSRWATNSGVRETPTTGLKATGFAAPQLVPDGIHNWLWGVLSDWTWWLYQAQKDIVIAPGFGTWLEFGGDVSAFSFNGGFGLTSPTLSPTELGTALVRSSTGVSGGGGFMSVPLSHNAGAASGGVTVEVIAISGSADLGLNLVDAFGNSVHYAVAGVTSTGIKELVYDSGSSTGTGTSSQALDGWVNVFMTVSCASPGDYVELNALTISY